MRFMIIRKADAETEAEVMPSTRPMLTSLCSSSRLLNCETSVIRVPLSVGVRVTVPVVDGIEVLTSPASSANPSRKDSPCGASTARNSHQPRLFVPSGPVMK